MKSREEKITGQCLLRGWKWHQCYQAILSVKGKFEFWNSLPNQSENNPKYQYIKFCRRVTDN